MLFIRKVTLKLKKDSVNDFKRIEETEILPMLRKQNGFRDGILCIAPARLEVLALSFWDTKETAQAFEKTVFPNIVKTVSTLLDGAPRIEPYELVVSTLHKFAAKA